MYTISYRKTETEEESVRERDKNRCVNRKLMLRRKSVAQSDKTKNRCTIPITRHHECREKENERESEEEIHNTPRFPPKRSQVMLISREKR